MERLEPLVLAELARMDAERKAAVDRDVVRDLRRALRGMGRRLPRYELPRVRDEGRLDRVRAGEDAGEAPEGTVLEESASERPGTQPPSGEGLPLFPPGL